MNANRKNEKSDDESVGRPVLPIPRTDVQAVSEPTGSQPSAMQSTVLKSDDESAMVKADGMVADLADQERSELSVAKVGAPETDMCQLDETLLASESKDDKFAETQILNPSELQSSIVPSLNDVATIIDPSASSVASASRCPIGSRIGDYEVTAELGRGGMGVVYRARHHGLNREAAIKMILHGKHSGDETVERFQAEARAVAQLHHPSDERGSHSRDALRRHPRPG